MDLAGFPWIRASFGLAIITCLAGVAGAHRRARGGLLASAWTYGGVGAPLSALLWYPGPSALNRNSDGVGLYLLVALAIIHAIGFGQIRRTVEEAEAHDQQT